MSAIIAAVIALFGLVIQLFGVGLQAAILVFKVLIGGLNLIIWAGNSSYTIVQNILLWFDGWLGPVGGAIKWVLNPAEIQRAFILALTFATTLWVLFSTVLNDAFYIMINPFFLNLFTSIGHFGFSLVAGVVVFVIDLIRRLFQGPTTSQLKMLKEWEAQNEKSS